MCIHAIRYAYIIMYMNMHGDLWEVVHYITMHIDMHGDITAHAYGIISSFTYKCMAVN